MNNTAYSKNYWSPLTSLVDKQDEVGSQVNKHTNIESVMSVLTDTRPGNKVVAHWAQKLENRKARRTGILDSGATSGVAPEEDVGQFNDSGQMSSKTIMLPDKRTHRATKMMLLKHKLREGAWEINIVPGLHTTLISVPKLADANYVTIFDKNEAKIYDATTTIVSTTQPPVLSAPQCNDTGLWQIPLHPNKPPDNTNSNQHPNPPQDTLNTVFDLPSSRKTLLWHHAALGFPTKETLIAAIRASNLSTWPGLTANTVHCLFPDSIETAKGHLKGQRQGIGSTRQKALDKLVKTAMVHIKQEHEDSPPSNILRHQDLSKTIHTDQTGGFPHTS